MLTKVCILSYSQYFSVFLMFLGIDSSEKDTEKDFFFFMSRQPKALDFDDLRMRLN